MNVKNIILRILTIMIAIIMVLPISSKAESQITLALDEFRGKDSDNNYNAYAIPLQHVWKIFQIEGNNTQNYDRAIFCLDLHRGFGSGSSEWYNAANQGKVYNFSKNMLTEGQEIKNDEKIFNPDSFKEEDYDKIVRILKNVYIKGITNREQFLSNNITGYSQKPSDFYITDKDIELAEQLAIWHYTNGNTTVGGSTSNNGTVVGGTKIGDILQNSNISEMYLSSYSDQAKTQIAKFITDIGISPASPTETMITSDKKYYRFDDSGSNSIEGIYKLSEQMQPGSSNGLGNRVYAIKEIYRSFLRIAEDTSSNTNETVIPLEMENNTTSAVESNGKFIAGPFKIKKNNDNYKNFSSWVRDGNDNNITNYTIYVKDANQEFVVSDNQTIQGVLNKEFYIGLPINTNIRKVKVGFLAKYEKTSVTYWTNSTAKSVTQPVAIVDKTEDNLLGEKEVDIPKPKVSIEVEKVWDDSENASGKRPTSIKVQLKADNVNVGNEIELNESTAERPWYYRWDNLDKYDSNGRIIVYTVEEVSTITGYIKDIKVQGNKTTITNKYEPEKTTREVQKIWNDNKNQEGKRPSSIKVQLKADGVNVGEPVILNDDNAWYYCWSDLDKEKNGTEIQYTIDELPFTNYNYFNRYESSIVENSGKFVITNSYKPFDLSLRKYIVEVNDRTITNSREPEINVNGLKDRSDTTAIYKHRKDPYKVETNDIVTYKLTIYNEGEIDGRATKIVDQLPTGLEFIEVVSGNFEKSTYDTDSNKLVLTRKELNTTNLKAFVNRDDLDSETIIIKCKVTEEPSKTNKKILTNVAWIAEEIDANDNTITNQPGADRDSEPDTAPSVNKDNMENYKGNSSNADVEPGNPDYYYKGQQDDDDFEKLYIEPVPDKEFDLSLRKFITEIGSKKINEREPKVDVSNLKPNGISEKTARYEHPKNPMGVNIGDIVTYTIRVYNEGDTDAYVGEVTDYLPEELDYITIDDIKSTTGNAQEIISQLENIIDGNTAGISEENRDLLEVIAFNTGYGWEYDKDTRKISTVILSNSPISSKGNNYSSSQKTIIDEAKDRRSNSDSALLKAFDGKKLDYLDLKIKCRVNDKAKTGDKITNIAEITEYEDEKGTTINQDRDSKPNNFPDDKKNNQYEGNGEVNGYYPGQEDDDDFERLIVEQFDLALRKFITNVDGKEITDRIPNPDTSKLNTKDENGNFITTATYNHIKTPITVVKGSKIVYTIRVYNEGDVDGYVNEITDYLPPELEFDKDSEINDTYKWQVSKDGRKVTTDYLSYEKGTKNLIKAYNANEKILDYKFVKIQCIVKDTAQYQMNITNLAQITEHSDSNGKDDITDRDSHPNGGFELPKDKDLPSYKDDEISKLYVPGQEDDDDFEKVNVVYFDLALRKIVSKAIIIENQEKKEIETKHKFEDDPEEIVKVDLGRKKLDKITVKFEYQIRIKNEGLIEGYAKEVKDYIPEGLMFNQEENPLWKQVSEGVITTEQLKDTLLKPGESKVISVVLTWKNSSNNLGVKTNTAEISKDYNNYNTPDIDSTPDNKKEGEDDIDIAEVMLAIALGSPKVYIGLSLTILTTMAIGIIGIKKFVL